MADIMRVLHVHTNPEWGGGEYQVLRLLARLPAHGVDVTLMAASGSPLWRAASGTVADVRSVPRFFRAAAIARVAREVRADVIHVHDSGGVAIGGRAGLAAGIPVVLTRRIASPLRRNPLSDVKYSPRRLSAVIAISDTVRDVMIRSGYAAERITVVQSGLDLRELDEVEPSPELRASHPGAVIAVGIGKLSSGKNWGVMLQAAAKLVHDSPEIHWYIAGSGPDDTELRTAARAAGVEDRVHFLGFREDALRLLRSADFLFFPSLREGAAVTVRQAMAMGVPVVAADAPGTMESLGGTGWLFPGRDPGAAAGAVRAMLADGGLRREKCAAAAALARERYSIEGTVRGTVACYQRLAAGRVAAEGGAVS